MTEAEYKNGDFSENKRKKEEIRERKNKKTYLLWKCQH